MTLFMREEKLEPLYVTCRNCGSQVPTGLQLSGKVYEIPADEGHEFTCPGCGTKATYTKAAFHIAAN
jgi:predicted RNA-binding Zn-ribbon protein involved in translation (DUF1610 family)